MYLIQWGTTLVKQIFNWAYPGPSHWVQRYSTEIQYKQPKKSEIRVQQKIFYYKSFAVNLFLCSHIKSLLLVKISYISIDQNMQKQHALFCCKLAKMMKLTKFQQKSACYFCMFQSIEMYEILTSNSDSICEHRNRFTAIDLQ